ncbi:hypothetical protein KEM60_00916 [Austwickia sp. TVS 96-490-7B]|uniref:hypothetical protein n=1 Tax=Austwickia sp. TVS 96-490-7B TaxID=2830843 RepID=UPI001C57BB62|nr:hypothetical protein [Austwickia sp. TVS 96-490-7B]MBW3084727.1 hypothetical protein [Austwickia sp. TVS 96-490-7B]
MVSVFTTLGIVHVGVAALILAGYIMSLSTDRAHPLMTWAARIQLVLGLVLVGIAEGGKVMVLDHAWVGAKLVIALGVVACCEVAAAGQRKAAPKPMLLHLALALTLVNVLVAYAFR